jgi:ABC-type lipoprotein release transport system permease subunit
LFLSSPQQGVVVVITGSIVINGFRKEAKAEETEENMSVVAHDESSMNHEYDDVYPRIHTPE